MYGNCIYCGVFTKVNRIHTCNDCHQADEQLLQQAKDILHGEGSMTVFELADRVGVEPGRVFVWLQSGRIQSRFFRYNCPLCGRDLLNGFCGCDKKSYTRETQSSVPKPMERFYSTRKVEQKREHYWDRVSKIGKSQKRDIWLFSKSSG